MPTKASAEARRQCIAAIIKAASPHVDPYAQVSWPAPDDPASVARRELELRQQFEAMSDTALEFERLRLSSRLGEEIGTSLLEDGQSHQAVSRRGAKKSVQTRQQRRLNIIERGRQLLAKQPKLRVEQAYKQLGLDGTIKLSSFERRYWPQIRKIRQTLAG